MLAGEILWKGNEEFLTQIYNHHQLRGGGKAKGDARKGQRMLSVFTTIVHCAVWTPPSKAFSLFEDTMQKSPNMHFDLLVQRLISVLESQTPLCDFCTWSKQPSF